MNAPNTLYIKHIGLKAMGSHFGAKSHLACSLADVRGNVFDFRGEKAEGGYDLIFERAVFIPELRIH